MSENNDQIRQRIEELIPINELPPNLQSKLLERGKILSVKKSRFIFKQGDKDDYSYYLLEGEIELHQNDQLNGVIEAGSDRAKYALAQLQPRQFSAKARTEIKILLIERNQLDQLMLLAQQSTLNTASDSGGSTIEVDDVDGVDDDTDWMSSMLQSELFSRIPTANIHQLFALLEEVEFNKGDVVIKQGDPGEHYYIISSGHCAVSRKPSPQAGDVKLAELKVGDSFGEEALISDSTRNATVTMTTDGVLMQLAKDTFIELVKKPTLQSLQFDEADALVNEGSAKWLDVRFPNEHKESSIEGSVNIPLNSLRLQADKLDTSTIYILFCDTGNRSSTGTFLLAERGFDVTYLDGGLMNNPEAIGVQTVVPKGPKSEPAPAVAKQEMKKEAAKPVEKPEQKPKQEPVHAGAKVELLNAELETTQIKMAKTKEAQVEAKAEANEAKKKELEENTRKLEEEKKQLEVRKKAAEEEAKKKAAEEELKLKKLKEQADAEMKAEQKKLEEIYNKNAEEMAKLQKAKEEAEEKIRKEREALEKQAEEARKQIEEAKRLKQEAEEASRKQLEAVEAEKKRLEEEGKKKQLEDEERERKLQAEAKAKIAEERKKLAEQYERNSQEFEQLQKEKAAAEAARAAAKQEAAKMIEEYKSSHDKEREQEQAKIKAERQKLEEEAKRIQQQMKLIQQAKLEAEKMKQEALEHASALKEKQMDSTSSQKQRDALEVEIKAAEEKAIVAERDIEDAKHKAKLTESAQQENQADLTKKKQQEQALSAQIAGDLEEFEEKQEEEAASITQVQMQADMMKRIKLKAAEAKKKAAKANENLLDDISKQLGEK